MKVEFHKFYRNLKTSEDIPNSDDEYIENIPLDEAEIKKKKRKKGYYAILNIEWIEFFRKNSKLLIEINSY